MSHSKRRNMIGIFSGIVTAFLLIMPLMLYAAVPSGDRAVEISKRARQSVNESGERLVSSTRAFFQAFAEHTTDLQEILDTKRALRDSGMLENRPDIEANINARFMNKVGALKKGCDEHVQELTRSLESFEETIAQAIARTQDVKAINSNYELALKEFKKREQKRYGETEKKAMEALESCDAGDKLACNRYRNITQRLRGIQHQATVYKTKLKTAQLNQMLGKKMRDKIKVAGPEIAFKMREALTKLYGVYHMLADIMELGGPDMKRSLNDVFGGLSTDVLMNRLDVTTAAIDKLTLAVDEMVGSILGDFDKMKPTAAGVSSLADSQINIEDEMKLLFEMRKKSFD